MAGVGASVKRSLPAPLALLLLQVLVVSAAKPTVLSVTYTPSPGSDDVPILQLHEGVVDGWIGKANFSDETFENGWGYLYIETRPPAPDAVQAYAAGYLEGAATHAMIYNAWRNTMEGFCSWQGADFCDELRVFLRRNEQWMKDMIEENSASDSLWYQVSLVLQQLSGLVEGYKNVSTNAIPDEEFLWMNLSGDLEDLEEALKHNKTGWVPRTVRGFGHCSALVKALPGNIDLYTSHVTWNSLQSMLRLQKKYVLPFLPLKLSPTNAPPVPGYAATFSSYPGIVHSADDYYLLSSGLVTMETTIGNSNPDLWVYVTPEGQLQEWIRALVANRLALDGYGWTEVFRKYNSGTYNNQWMIVNYKLFTPMMPIKPNTLWVLEQIPNLVVAADQSHYLKYAGYWPSYNVPFYPEVFNKSGIPALVDQYGDWFTYDKTSRALIFARDQDNVRDLGSMINLMRYNDYKNDPLSTCECDPPYSGENGISARSDLNPKNGTYPFPALGHRSHAGTDVKVTALHLLRDLEFLAVNGPSHAQQPVFQWSTSDFANDTAHFGHPDVWEFPLVHRKWS